MKTIVRFPRIARRRLAPGVVALVLAVPLAVVAVSVRAPLLRVLAELDNGVERIAFAGQIDIASRIIDDPVFNGPTMLEMVVDFRSVRGVGRANGRAFGTEAQTVVHRPLLPFDEFELTFPYQPGNDVHSARTAKATISVAFTPQTGLRMTSKLDLVCADVVN